MSCIFISILAEILAVLGLPKASSGSHCTAPDVALEDHLLFQQPSEGSTCEKNSCTPPISSSFSLKLDIFTNQQCWNQKFHSYGERERQYCLRSKIPQEHRGCRARPTPGYPLRWSSHKGQ